MEKDPNTLLSIITGTSDATRWMLAGIGLLGIELFTGSTYILWPAIAAIVVAIWVFFLPLGFGAQLIIFFLLSLVLLVIGHLYVRPMSKSGEPQDLNDPARTMIGRRVKAVMDFDNGEGRVQVGDTQWKARMDVGDARDGDKLIITRVVGATLVVEPLS